MRIVFNEHDSLDIIISTDQYVEITTMGWLRGPGPSWHVEDIYTHEAIAYPAIHKREIVWPLDR